MNVLSRALQQKDREQRQTSIPGFAPKFGKLWFLWLEKKLTFSEFWVLQSTAAHVQENGEKREEGKKENLGDFPPLFLTFLLLISELESISWRLLYAVYPFLNFKLPWVWAGNGGWGGVVNAFPFSEAAISILQVHGEGKWISSDAMTWGPKYCYDFFRKNNLHNQLINQEFQNGGI